jgi:regulator of sirC expression with transglutaminase-like and TPR domain
MTPIDLLQKILAGRNDDFNLAEGALLLACEEYPDLDVAAYLAKLDEMGETLARRLRPDISIGDRILALNRFLYEEHRFQGNAENYYDPRNSFLNDVLDRKIGIPITLALVYIEVGRRLKLPLAGVSFPGHFLVKCPIHGGTVVIDPFHKGASLSIADLQHRLAQTQDGAKPSKTEIAAMLVKASNREILARILRNLKGVYLHFSQLPQALSACERLLMIEPDQPGELRDRAMLYVKLECFRAALVDFERLLELEPEAQDADALRERVVELRQAAARLN